PVSGRWHTLSLAIISSSCGGAEVIAGGRPFASQNVVKMEIDRRRTRGHVRVISDENAHLACLVWADIDDEPPVLAGLNHIEQGSGKASHAECELATLGALVRDSN